MRVVSTMCMFSTYTCVVEHTQAETEESPKSQETFWHSQKHLMKLPRKYSRCSLRSNQCRCIFQQYVQSSKFCGSISSLFSIKFWIPWRTCVVVRPEKIFHSNTTGLQSRLSNSSYSGGETKLLMLSCSLADPGSCGHFPPRHSTESEKTYTVAVNSL